MEKLLFLAVQIVLTRLVNLALDEIIDYVKAKTSD